MRGGTVDIGLALLLLAVLGYLSLLTVAITGTVDALQFPQEVWTIVNRRRSIWAWQVLGVVCLPVVLVYSGTYFFRVRPRLLAAQLRLETSRWSSAEFDARTFAADVEAEQAVGSSVRLRMPVYARIVLVVPLLLILAEQIWLGSSQAGSARAIQLAIMLMLVALLFGLNSWFGITLTPVMAVVHNVRRRQLRWSDIAAVTQQSFFGSRRVVLWTNDGRRTALRVPIMAFPGLVRRPFDHDYHLIGRWWLAHRGATPSASGP
jgi:hypothetical protein